MSLKLSPYKMLAVLIVLSSLGTGCSITRTSTVGRPFYTPFATDLTPRQQKTHRKTFGDCYSQRTGVSCVQAVVAVEPPPFDVSEHAREIISEELSELIVPDKRVAIDSAERHDTPHESLSSYLSYLQKAAVQFRHVLNNEQVRWRYQASLKSFNASPQLLGYEIVRSESAPPFHEERTTLYAYFDKRSGAFVPFETLASKRFLATLIEGIRGELRYLEDEVMETSDEENSQPVLKYPLEQLPLPFDLFVAADGIRFAYQPGEITHADYGSVSGTVSVPNSESESNQLQQLFRYAP